uniref:Macaca fascicularis brain cDNA clone: QmoA-12551, similar to human protein tyrosine phosphatase type IVA, member 1(PTP4A1), mRNA, RefSeq: NM_003463.2 n=1 Tax=Macaca fascicularis TaxID=9541 RepID=I7GJ79_MACFA|nr:unnamed protein product [Macaca fascicularis]
MAKNMKDGVTRFWSPISTPPLAMIKRECFLLEFQEI